MFCGIDALNTIYVYHECTAIGASLLVNSVFLIIDTTYDISMRFEHLGNKIPIENEPVVKQKGF